MDQRTRYFKNLNLTLVWYLIISKLVHTNFRANTLMGASIILSTLVKQLNFLKFHKNQSNVARHYKSLYKLKKSIHVKPPVSNSQLKPKLFCS